MGKFLAVPVIFGTLIGFAVGPAVAAPAFTCAYTHEVGVEVLSLEAVRLAYRGYSFEAPAIIDRTRTMVIVSFAFEQMGIPHRLRLVADLNGQAHLQRADEPLTSDRQRTFPCEFAR